MPSWSRLGTVWGRFWVGFGSFLGRFWGRLKGLGRFFLWSWASLRGLRVSWWVFVGFWRRLLIFGPLLLPAFMLLHVACWVPAACLRNSRQCNALPVPMLSQVYVGGPFGNFLALFFDFVFTLISGLVFGAFWGAFGAQNGTQNRPQDGQKGVLEPTSEKHLKMMRNSTPETLRIH